MLKVPHNANGEGLEVLSKQMNVSYREIANCKQSLCPKEMRLHVSFSEEQQPLTILNEQCF